jgi:hypothetical protein
MTAIDLTAAAAYLAGNGRLLDRRRFALLLGQADAAAVLLALDAYRNPDGGYGWGLEPDLRSTGGQPAGALHAFEVMAEVGPATTPRATELADWLESHSLPDGGVPMALPVTDPEGSSPIWTGADSTISSMQITSAIAGQAHRVAGHDSNLATHPWLARATRFCLDAIGAMGDEPHAYEVSFALQFLDAVSGSGIEVDHLVARLGRHLESDGSMAVTGGVEGETLHLLDFSPLPACPSRTLVTTSAVAADLDRLAELQQPDGGWTVGYESASPAASLEWRGYATVKAVATLQANGR